MHRLLLLLLPLACIYLAAGDEPRIRSVSRNYNGSHHHGHHNTNHTTGEEPSIRSVSRNYNGSHHHGPHNTNQTTGGDPSSRSVSRNYNGSHHHGHHNTNHTTVVTKRSVHSRFHAHQYKRLAGTRSAKRATVSCDNAYYYRSADGTCNNLDNPSWGAADQTYQRLLDPVYDDGIEVPRLKQVDGKDLSSPRDISVVMHDFDISRPHPKASVMLMEWGQFLAHDLASTPVDDADLVDACCYDELVTGSSLHPDVESGGSCFPIIISDGDRYFTTLSNRCMEFVRSYPVTETSGVREQMSTLSAYIDGGMIYGASISCSDTDTLRSCTGGKLTETSTENLPESDTNYCISTDSSDYCLEAGDSRVNVYPGLGALHTIFMRYHNYVAGELATTHTDYDDEKLFQEARKIVIAVIQRITYGEYIQMIIGSTPMNTYGLDDTWVYDDTCDATLYNVFATAAFRFGHSMVPDALLINGVNVSSVDLYERPYYVLNYLDSMIEGLVQQHAELADRWYSEGMTDHLFEETEQEGFDVVSLNIQRGRDHGLPAYNDWRDLCNLGRYTSFSDTSFDGRFSQVYSDINDIDLYSGALAELPDGSLVGPTYACLLGKQFAKLRNCDRFWWENTDTNIGFATDRLRKAVKRVKLSHVICLTTGITEISKSAFRVVDADTNPVELCSDLLSNGLNLSLF